MWYTKHLGKTNYNHLDYSASRQSYEGLHLTVDQTKVYFKCLSFWVFHSLIILSI